MYIAPNSIIRIMHNVPLDETYNHTVKFASKSAQETYFSGAGVVKYTLNNQSYQRVEKGKMRVEIKAEDLYDCNYLSFQNTSFGNKWFYAFITGIEYVNNVTSEISFEIDVMQTYLFDIEVKQCFVEREHAVDDSIGANTIAEPIDCPEAEVVDGKDLTFINWYIVVNFSPSYLNIIAEAIGKWCHYVNLGIDTSILNAPASNAVVQGLLNFIKYLNGIVKTTAEALYPNNMGEIREIQFTGQIPYVSQHYFAADDDANAQVVIQEVCDAIDRMNVTGGTVLSVYQVPEEIVNNSWADSTAFDVPPEAFDPIPNFTYINKTGVYTPKNNKLYTSPYQYLKVINKQGGEMNLAYEKVQSKAFYYQSSFQNGNVSCFISNSGYGTKVTGTSADDLTRLELSNFPVCNFNNGGMLSKLASIIPRLVNAITMTASGGTKSMPIQPTAPTQQRNSQGQFQNTGQYIQQYQQYQQKMQNYENAQKRQDFGDINNYISAIGNISNNIIGGISNINSSASSYGNDVANTNFGFGLKNMAITGEYAEIVDNFFERFGYAVKKNKVPNMSSRPHWNYVKTTDAYITGNCPADALAKIISIFNHGITFWKVPSEVGNYSLNNH